MPQESLFVERELNRRSAFDEAQKAYEDKNVEYFADRLDRTEHYRIALTFPESCLFLDIETTGLSRYYNHITAVGWSKGKKYGFFVKGQDDAALKEAIATAKSLVTFNGTLFDLPFIRQEFPDIQFPRVHIDLRFLAKRVGLTGGQKEIEKRIRVTRSGRVREVTGEFAPVLWHRYAQGDLNSLKVLLEYNAADIGGMKAIFDHVATKLLKSSRLPKKCWMEASFGSFDERHAKNYLSREIKKLLLPYPRGSESPLRIEDLVVVDQLPRLRVVGIDLTGSEARPSGWCLLDGRDALTDLLGSDDEIVARTAKENPHLVSIDSPLTLPDGRLSVSDDDPGREQFGIMRYCERVLKKRGVNVYPALLPSMQRLTARGIHLANRFRFLGIPTIESYPGAAQDIMQIPRKRQGLEFLEEGLAAFGVSGTYIKGGVSHDELDAITSAVVGVFFWAGMYERLGRDPLGDEALIIPDLRVNYLERRKRRIIGLSGSLGAGKTTAADHLVKLGYVTCRYSQVIGKRVAAHKPNFTRDDLQREGDKVHRELGQRWLGRELLSGVSSSDLIVIDGVRFPEDHAFLTEIFGAQFLHIHVVAPEALRRQRFVAREGKLADFEAQNRHPIEQMSSKLAELARDVVDNQGDIEAYLQKLDRIIERNRSE